MRTAKYIRRTLFALAGVVVLAAVFLLTPWGLNWTAHRIVGGLSIFKDASLEVGRIEGNVFHRLTLHDARLIKTDGSPLVALPSTEIRYRLGPLISGVVHLTSIRAEHPEITMSQDADGIWDLLNVVETDTTASEWIVRIDRVDIGKGDVTADSYAGEGRDSTYRIHPIDIALQNIEFGREVRLTVNSLQASMTTPGGAEPVELDVRAALTGRSLDLDNLRLSSSKSDVTGSGTIYFPGADSLDGHTDFALSAKPLQFNDVRLFAPWLSPDREVELFAEIEGPSNDLTGRLHVESDEGSEIDIDGAFGFDGEGGRSYRLRAEIPLLDTRMFSEELIPAGAYQGNLDLDLSGPQSDKLSGAVRGYWVHTPFDLKQKKDSTRFTAHFTDGLAQTDLDAIIDDAVVAVRGHISPLNDRPTYDLTAEVRNFDIANYTDGEQSSTIQIEADLEGQGFSLAEMAGAASIRIEPSSFNGFSMSAGTLGVNIRNQKLMLQGRIDSPQGTIQTSGRIGIEDRRIEAFTGHFERFNLAALLGDTLNSAVTGSIEARDVLVKEEYLEGELTLDLIEAEYGVNRLEESRLESFLEAQQVSYSMQGQLNGGAFALAGAVEPFGEEPIYEIKEGSFADFDVNPFIAPSQHRSKLSGRIALVGEGLDVGSIRTRGRLDLTTSTFNRQAIQDASIEFLFQGDTLTTDIQLDLPEGSSRLNGFVTETTTAPHLRIQEGVFAGLDLGKILDIPDLSTRLTGTLEGNARGKDLATLETATSLRLNNSKVNGATIHDGSANVLVERQRATLNTEMIIDNGRLDLDVTAQNLSGRAEYQLRGRLEEIDICKLLKVDSTASIVNASFEGEGEGIEPETMSLKGVLTSSSSVYRGIRLDDLNVEFSLEEGLLEVDTLRLRSNVAQVDGQGPIALYDDRGASPSDFVFDTRLLDISPIAPFLNLDFLSLQEGQVNARVYGRPGTLRFDSRADIEGLVYDDIHIGDISSRMIGELDRDRSLELAELSGSIEAISIPGFLVEEINIEAGYENEEVVFEVDGRLDSERNGRMSGRLFANADSQRVQFDVIDLKLDEDQWALDQPAIVEVGRGYRVRRFLMASGDQQIALDGVINFRGNQNLLVTIENFKAGTVADLAGFPGLDGPLNGFFDIQGPATALEILGDAELHVFSFDEEAGDLAFSLEYLDRRLNLDASMQHINGHSMQFSGFLPVQLALVDPEKSKTGSGISQEVAEEGEVNLQLQADSMQINWILPFLDPALVSRIDGLVTAEASLTGTASSPRLEGKGRIDQGRLRSPFLGVTYSDISTGLSFSENFIELSDTRLATNDGNLTGRGTIALESLTSIDLDIDIQADRFKAIDTREYQATASGALKLTGSYVAPSLTGNVRVLSADMFLDETSDATADLNVQLTEADILMLESEFGIRAGAADTTTFDLYEALAMDIDILLERDTWVRSRKNPEMNVQLSGEVDLNKSAYEEHVVFGTIEVNPDRSYINQFSKRFNITHGTVTFNGKASDPLIDFEAQYEVPSRRSQDNAVTVNLDMEGRVAELDLTLTSEPTMELTDIISYVVTGRPASEALQLGGAGQGVAVTQGVGLLTGAIESLFQDSGLDLDVIQIEPIENGRGATVTAGKYVTPRLFTAVSQPIGASNSDGSTRDQGTVITLELELIDSLLLRLLGGESVMQINLLWHHAY